MALYTVTPQALSDIMGLTDVEFEITGVRQLDDGSIEFRARDTTETLQGQNSQLILNYENHAVIRTLTTNPEKK